MGRRLIACLVAGLTCVTLGGLQRAGAGPAPGMAGAGSSDGTPAGVTVPVRSGQADVAAGPVVLRYPGAMYVAVRFGDIALPPGEAVTVSDLSGREIRRYTSADRGRWAISVAGDGVVVAVAGGPAAGHAADRVRLAEAAYGRRSERTARPESLCGGDDSRDAVCYRSTDPVLYANSRPVARLLIDGVKLCTAWRVGPDNRMLTNNHCLADTATAQNTEVWFGYACAVCGDPDTVRPVTKVRASAVLATDAVLDFTLFTVEDFPSVERFGYLELDPQPPQQGDELYIPQHPTGSPLRVAGGSPAGNCAVVEPEADGFGPGTDVTYRCDTQGGSSGAPVLSRRTNKVVGLHHLGGCPNSAVRMTRIVSVAGSLL